MYEYFPTNYPWSLAVAMAIGMRGEMSEIADACRPLETFASGVPGPVANEAWFQNWSVLAQRLDQLAAEAVEQKRDLSAGEYCFRASNYHLTAERTMGWSDARRSASYRKALASFKKGYELSGHRTQRVEVTNKVGNPLAGYLRLPQGSGPFPALVCFNGFDSVKEMLYMLYAEGAVRRGIAILFIDQEGTGEALCAGLISTDTWIPPIQVSVEIRPAQTIWENSGVDEMSYPFTRRKGSSVSRYLLQRISSSPTTLTETPGPAPCDESEWNGPVLGSLTQASRKWTFCPAWR